MQEIAVKTKELITNLQGLAVEADDGFKYITLETLRQRKMQPVTENFLFNLALAEGMVKT